MKAYECPNCRGGFPELVDGCCPWCGQSADGEFERERPQAISRVVSENGKQPSRGLISRLRGEAERSWEDSNGD